MTEQKQLLELSHSSEILTYLSAAKGKRVDGNGLSILPEAERKSLQLKLLLK